MIAILNGIIAIVAGVGGAVIFYWLFNAAVERLPKKQEAIAKPYVFIGPAIAVVGLFLIYPAVRTIWQSFYGRNSEEFAGLSNYTSIFTDQAFLGALWNNVLWIILVPTISVAVGLAVATLADKLKPRWENISKSLIFLPMAISFVGASTIWGFMYRYEPSGTEQTGLLNAIWTSLGGQPIAWLNNTAINDFSLIVIMIWLQAGFAMVLLSAAIKNVPNETLEAARIDGATELQIFWRVVVPQIASTIVVVATTITILVLKVFDIVYVLTNGNFGTEVVANAFIKEIFTNGNFGRAAAMVVVLMAATIPIMILNVKRFREEESIR